VTSRTGHWRLEVVERDSVAAAVRLAERARTTLGTVADGVERISKTELYLVDRELGEPERRALHGAIVDHQTQVGHWLYTDLSNASASIESKATEECADIEIALRPGVTDPVGVAFEQAASLLGLPAVHARSGTRFRFEGLGSCEVAPTTAHQIAQSLLRNDIVDEMVVGVPIVARFIDSLANDHVEVVPVRSTTLADLVLLSKERGLALDPEELLVLQRFFVELDRDPTDAEIETIAQTWSEHCSHKTFRARIVWPDGALVEPLLKQLRRSTDEIAASWVKSAFVDNAGIIEFDSDWDVAVKVETHNHPSAVEPFGGANTGVGGVIRDVLGVAADPIAVTDILCFGPLDTRAEELPEGVLHPRRIRDGVIAGIADYGNKMGLPTVAGAVAHQEGFTANPLVFAGCIGLRPSGLVLTGQQPGDRIVVIGGATGRDGIRGATFSSTTMDATTGDVAGASVQIGDPIIEKLVADVLRDARDAAGGCLFTAITDCGAGGFSSAIGELAAGLGADVNLDTAPTKYPGLAPWELWLSEAQERMVMAVHPRHIQAFQELCDTHGVLFADVGEFRSDGQLKVRRSGHLIVDLPGSFLHDGRPQRSMTAVRPIAPASSAKRDSERVVANAQTLLLQILMHADVRSNEDIVRGYDHEILGGTIGRPYLGAADDGPADAAVIAPLVATSGRGLAIGIGMNCRTGAIDSRRMAEAVVDEAIRNVVAVGADPDRIALLDNFSWGDPRRPEMLGRLIDAVEGCCIAANAHRAPFVSGKDSLNNEYETADGGRRSIPPTLVITALGQIENAERMVTSDAKTAGNVVVLVGETRNELRGSVLDAVLGYDADGVVPGGDSEAPRRYRSVHSVMADGLVQAAHDVGEGGLVAAAAEMAMGGRLGVTLEVSAVEADDLVATLFSESCGRLLLEVKPEDLETVCARTGGIEIGSVTLEQRFVFRSGTQSLIDIRLSELLQAWRGHVDDGAVAV
jgi:phosphoribosylformylglycinamidine synthase subunit PurSL